MGRRKIVKPIRWQIGLPFDIVRMVCEKKKIKLVSRTILNYDEIEDLAKDDAIVRWKLSNGQHLTFERTRGQNDRGALRYRITKIEQRERIGARTK